ncbi:phage Mu protein F like protein [Clostridium puniceum]|uniref:Phage Mu protein F like protein n=1 Tax=Clostridium puniceum TaxID=29367 RepID=A0A1S8T5Z7_9CLOT|nr:hypothetical protein [Clostridium puniceum]OOM72905.1 phage Mu protein F like protein [Clostridium puniceum]
MNEYKKRVLQARNEFRELNFEQEKELFKIYNDSGNKLIGKILNMTDSRTKTHNIEIYKIINEYRTELYHNLNKTIENNIFKSSDIQKGVQLSFVDMIAPDVKTKDALKRTVTKISSDSVKQLIAGEYYKDGKTLSKRLWNITGDNGNKIDAIIKDNIAKGANVRELAKELEKHVNPKNRITPKTFADGIGGDNISYQARRLARTSITHAQTETLIQNAKKNPFCKGLKWNLSASHFSRMHGKLDICDDYNGRTFKPEEVPLQHPNCLCYFTEVLEELDKCIETMKSWSNGKKNPAIDEWIKPGEDKTSIKVTTPKEIQTKINIDNRGILKKSANKINDTIIDHDASNISDDSIDIKDFVNRILGKNEKTTSSKITLSQLPKEDYENILGIINESPKKVKNKMFKYAEKVVLLNIEVKGVNRYSSKDGGIYYNLNRDKNNVHGKGKYATLFHEIGHLIDKNMDRPSMKSKVFKDLIIKDTYDFINSSKSSINIESDNEIYDIIKAELESDNRYHSVADIFGGVTKNKISNVRFGHSEEYWERSGALERETFAHFFEATIRNDKFKLENFKNIFPNAYKEFKRMLKEE